MNVKKILEYAMIGAKKTEDYYKARMKHEDIAIFKDYMQEKSLLAHKDYQAMRDMYIKHSDLLKDWEILL